MQNHMQFLVQTTTFIILLFGTDRKNSYSKISLKGLHYYLLFITFVDFTDAI